MRINKETPVFHLNVNTHDVKVPWGRDACEAKFTLKSYLKYIFDML